jgi:3-methyladenine DNA glycosylase AlkC
LMKIKKKSAAAIGRKGARTVATVDAEVLAALEAGQIETANLTEGLAIRMDRLMSVVAPDSANGAIDMSAGVVARMAQAGAALRRLSPKKLTALASHTSDTVRGWAAFAIGQDDSLAPMARIDAMRHFAIDAHFGVREWAWMAVRAVIVAEPLKAIERLTAWSTDANIYAQRFASEATRPRGVWAASIPLLRQTPKHALPILLPLRFTPDRYVEDSLANWLNDAAKDNPVWVKSLLASWAKAGVAERLISRASRSLPTK